MALPGHRAQLSLINVLLAVVLASTWSMSGAQARQSSQASSSTRSQPVLFKAKQGEVIYLRMLVDGRPVSISATFRERSIPFFPVHDSEYAALVGIDMADDVETDQLKADITYPDGVEKRIYRVAVAREEFHEQRMTLPKDQVDPDEAALRRIALEREKVKTVFAGFTPERLWSQSFVVPVEGTTTGRFGSKRILNGQPRNQHNGEDIAAPRGTPVRATNGGIVKMVDDHFFSGLGVILDHGLGLYTMYFHLDTAQVKEGDHVTRGQFIATVGQSGRATGPHLHWGAWLNGSRVNPFALTKLPIER
jgi:murein DD-endopeptidase MepM/ murein hydrolase activator NlpD